MPTVQSEESWCGVVAGDDKDLWLQGQDGWHQFVHVLDDRDFALKVSIIEHVDQLVPALLDLKPEVLIVTGDHSTPALLKLHSWHPVPTLLHSRYCRADPTDEFSERGCSRGALGRFPAVDLMPIAMANALRLTKYGA